MYSYICDNIEEQKKKGVGSVGTNPKNVGSVTGSVDTNPKVLYERFLEKI